MKKMIREPRLLPSVMEAIARLKEKKGSTQNQIVEHVGRIIRRNIDGYENIAMQVRRALEHGLHSGLIKRRRSGKFTLGLDRRDYAILRRFGILDDLPEDRSGRRGRRSGKRGRKSRRRRSGRKGHRGLRRPFSNEDDISDGSGSDRIPGSFEPMDKGRRRSYRRGRRGKSGRRGRTSRRGIKHTVSDKKSSDSSDKAHTDSNAAIPPEKKTSDEDTNILYCLSKSGSSQNDHQEGHQDRSQEQQQDLEEDTADCGNLEYNNCSVKQENEFPRCLSREHGYLSDSHLN